MASIEYFLVWCESGTARIKVVPGMPGALMFRNCVYSQVKDRYLGDFCVLLDRAGKVGGFRYEYLALEMADPFFESELVTSCLGITLKITRGIPDALSVDFVAAPLATSPPPLNIGSVLYVDRGHYILGIPRWEKFPGISFRLVTDGPEVKDWSDRLAL